MKAQDYLRVANKLFLALIFLINPSIAGQSSNPLSTQEAIAKPVSARAVDNQIKASNLQSSKLSLAAPHLQANISAVMANGLDQIKWDKDRLITFGKGTTQASISTYEKDGKLVFSAPLKFENSAKTYVKDAAATYSGTVAVAVSTTTVDGVIADLIVEAGENGIQRAVRTSPFNPLKICATQEGTVWAYGWERDASGSDRHGHHAMLREFSFEKGQLRSAIDRDTVRPPQGVPVHGRKDELQMKCSTNKVAVFNGPVNELIEYDLANSKVTRQPTPFFPENVEITGAAFTNAGEFYLSTLDRSNPQVSTSILHLILDADGNAEWVPIATLASNGKWFRLLGNDTDDLVYARGLREPSLYWSAIIH